MNEFTHKVALVTGAGGGLGREIALAFSSLGVSVAANDINPINLDETISLIHQAGGAAEGYVFDIAKRMPVEAMVSQVLEHFGRIDFLVNYASVTPVAAILDMDEWEFHRTLDVNLGGPYFCIQQVGRVMRQHGGGAIVNLVSTVGSERAHKGHTAYSASQAGLIGLTRAAAAELSEFNIRLNAVCCSAPELEHAAPRRWEPAALQKWRQTYSHLRLQDHPDLVTLVLYLCSEGALDLAGQFLYLDLLEPV